MFLDKALTVRAVQAQLREAALSKTRSITPRTPVVSKNTNELEDQRDQLPQSERKVRSREWLGGLLRF